MSSESPKLKYELLELVRAMSPEEVSHLYQNARLRSICSTWEGVNIGMTLPADAITSIGSFLDASRLREFQMCCKQTMSDLDILWREIGAATFRNLVVGGATFRNAAQGTNWNRRYVRFAQSLRIDSGCGVMSPVDHHTMCTSVPAYQKVSCTLPAGFSVLTSGSTFIEMTVSVKFSPEAVRSVIGLIEAPIGGSPHSLSCDRGLSRKHWGLAFGPLTGVVSSQGKYFDDFQTYRARHGLKDYLSLAMEEPVTVRVGILIDRRRIAFYRLPESDYADWECTGFVYETTHAELFPCLMFSHIGARDAVQVTINRVGSPPPYFPHVNEVAADLTSWSSFAEDGLESATRPPPNSPMYLPRPGELTVDF